MKRNQYKKWKYTKVSHWHECSIMIQRRNKRWREICSGNLQHRLQPSNNTVVMFEDRTVLYHTISYGKYFHTQLEVCPVLISEKIRDMRTPRDQTPRDENFETRSRDEISRDGPTRCNKNKHLPCQYKSLWTHKC